MTHGQVCWRLQCLTARILTVQDSKVLDQPPRGGRLNLATWHDNALATPLYRKTVRAFHACLSPPMPSAHRTDPRSPMRSASISNLLRMAVQGQSSNSSVYMPPGTLAGDSPASSSPSQHGFASLQASPFVMRHSDVGSHPVRRAQKLPAPQPLSFHFSRSTLGSNARTTSQSSLEGGMLVSAAFEAHLSANRAREGNQRSDHFPQALAHKRLWRNDDLLPSVPLTALHKASRSTSADYDSAHSNLLPHMMDCTKPNSQSSTLSAHDEQPSAAPLGVTQRALNVLLGAVDVHLPADVVQRVQPDESPPPTPDSAAPAPPAFDPSAIDKLHTSLHASLTELLDTAVSNRTATASELPGVGASKGTRRAARQDSAGPLLSVSTNDVAREHSRLGAWLPANADTARGGVDARRRLGKTGSVKSDGSISVSAGIAGWAAQQEGSTSSYGVSSYGGKTSTSHTSGGKSADESLTTHAAPVPRRGAPAIKSAVPERLSITFGSRK